MGLNPILGLFVGISAFAAVNHLFVGARGDRARTHQAMGAFAAVAAAYISCSVWLYSATDVETLRVWSRVQGALAALIAVTGFRFAHMVLGGWRKSVAHTVTVGLLTIAAASLVMPAGIFYGQITGLRRVDAGSLGLLTFPVASANPVQALFNLLVYVPVVFIAGRAVTLFLRGRRLLALVAGIAVVIPAVPALFDTFVLGVDTFTWPVNEAALALSLIFLSLAVSEDVARTAGLREEIETSEARHRWLVETAPEAIGVYDTEQRRFILVNRVAEELFGRSADELSQADPTDLLYRYTDNPAARVETARSLLSRALGGERTVVEWPVARPDGSLVPCELRFTPLGAPMDSLIRVSLLDITEQKAREAARAELEARMRRSEKLQTIGTLADGIAHDFNDILMPLVAFGELAAAELEGHPAEAYLVEMRASADRATELVHQIFTYGGTTEDATEVIVLEPVVKQALRFLRAALPPKIELRSTLTAPDARIRGDITRVHQIVMNLGLNASHAMGEAGELVVTLRSVDDVVELRMQDSGHGMDEVTLSHIFDPFFTTKGPGQGTGLGLSIVRDIVHSWRGSIDVESTPGHGTAFSLRLPLLDQAGPPEAARREPRRGDESVLLVDDDPPSLEAIDGLLKSLGYSVTRFNDPEAALEASTHGRFHVCVTDFDMPGMNGVALADHLRATMPELPVLLTTGSAEGMRQQPRTTGRWLALTKPFNRVELGDALRDVLET